MDAFHPYADLFANPKGPGDARPTALQVIEDSKLGNEWTSRVVLITGGTSGLGLETARALHTAGADVYITARDSAKAKGVVEDITKSSKGNGKFEVIDMNLSSLDSVKKAAQAFLDRSTKLNVLINNAGIMAVPEPTKTKDGFDEQFGVNHLAHFTFTTLLLPILIKSSTPEFNSRVVAITSSGHRFSPIRFDDYNFTKGEYNPWLAYGQSKTGNIWMSNYIDRVYGPRGVHSVSVQPGICTTPLHVHIDPAQAETWQSDPAVAAGIKTPEQGAATPTWAAIADVWEGKGGKYLFDVALGGPAAAETAMSMADHGYGPHAFDEEGENKLWDLSLKLTGVKLEV
ncbi:Short-chain dehydrogenase TIC 32 [Colletotrichum sp. SAR 10_70]|nr:Short-chain dehydrogenase TIC 32 [Colletotrichum sp. SAR 10_71]KAI8203371.1 Short-chain dehydrogenase TIC 32 [Colletotrichum sp. SAR 10_70]KAI8206116.1 Short-chain dehydrogenase TIC 32 [Colletotrichum sp. SAR 10_65]KAI8210257.1 Short-chain dehydrogenase TIC 32 [Colletotrichum sp. SAR 10_76]